MGGDGDLLRSQIAYYRRRAGEYDRTAYGTDLAAARARIATLLDLLQPEGLVLEIACGTGMWTEQLVGRSDLVVGLDAAQEAVALARTGSGQAPASRSSSRTCSPGSRGRGSTRS